jgi:hypothetical protein
MDNISICVSFIATLLGIAYPILFEVVSRLDEKYSSQAIIELFRSERENRLFVIALLVSLLSILIWMLKFQPLKIHGKYYLENSAQYILIFSTIALIICFFFFVRKILIYYTPTRFVPYLINRHRSENE